MKKLIIANWKMNGSLELFDEFCQHVLAAREKSSNVIFALPGVLLGYASKKNLNIEIAGQDCSIFNGYGAKTGEISAKMLRALGARYAIIGHSERRESCGDTVENVYKKLQNCVDVGMNAVFCVSENYQNLIDSKTSALLAAKKDEITVAYEPVSAIGTGILPTIAEIQKSIEKIKNKYDGIKTVYGGSVNAENASKILAIENVDGVLIGGASLKIDQMQSILREKDVDY